MIESQLWFQIHGTVSGVVDGGTILVTVADDQRRVRVHLAGLGLLPGAAASEKARARLSELALHKPVEILVNPSKWFSAAKCPKEDTAVVDLHEGGSIDLGFALLSEGLVRFEKPPPYAMSNYTVCQYRRAAARATGNSG